jgi:fibronectin-binding autotransporter adhesin
VKRSRKVLARAARRTVVAAFTSTAVVVAVVALGSPALAAIINANCSTTNLQAKIDSASPGSTLLIKGTCIGNFTVNKNLTLKGNPSATLDGNDAGSTLTIPSSRTVQLFALTISGGSGVLGGGITRTGTGTGALTLDHVTVENNVASGAFAEGGGIFSENAPLHLTASRVTGNRVVASGSGGVTAVGGGIVSEGPLTLTSSTVSSNRAVASSPGAAAAFGGGVFGSGPLVVTGSHVDATHATAVAGDHAVADAGGINWATSEGFTVQSSTISGNVVSATTTAGTQSAVGLAAGFSADIDSGTVTASVIANNQLTVDSFGGAGAGSGGGGSISASTRLTIDHTRITGNRISVTGATTAQSMGGGVSGGPLTIRSSTISNNSIRADGGSGFSSASAGGLGAGGPLVMSKTTVDQNHVVATSDSNDVSAAGGGMSAASPSTIVVSTISRNTIRATAQGAHNASAQGGGLAIGGPNSGKITNSTIANNLIRVESDAATGSGVALGGGIDANADSLLVVATTVARNLVGGVAHDTTFQGGGLNVGIGITTLEASILGLNTAPAAGSPNCFGPVASQGHNVLGTTAGCTFTSKPSDRLNRDPKLGALGNNGGPTLTLALLNGSPALNLIQPAQCPVHVDQRGVHRPQGPGCDAGSFERHV